MVAKASLLILDRDGVLNETVSYSPESGVAPRKPQDLIMARRPLNWRRSLESMQFVTSVATNQPDVARSKISLSSLRKINLTVQKRFFIDSVFTCLHDDIDECFCRKPKPGLLLAAMHHHSVPRESTIFVGDRTSDQAAAVNAGVSFVGFGPRTRFTQKNLLGCTQSLEDLLLNLQKWKRRRQI